MVLNTNPWSLKDHRNASIPVFGICLISFAFLYFFMVRPSMGPVMGMAFFGAGLLFSSAAAMFARCLEMQEEDFKRQAKSLQGALTARQAESKIDHDASAAICWLSQVLFADPEPNNLLESTIEVVSKVLKADSGSIMLLNKNQDLFVAYSSGIPPQIARKIRIKLGERISGKVALTRHEYLLNGSLQNYPEFRHVPDNPKISSAIVCPMMVCNNHVVGVLTLNRAFGRENFKEPHLRYALIFASQIAQIVRNAEFEHRVLRAEAG